MAKQNIPERLARIDEKIDTMHITTQDILNNVKATNGRVTKLEMWRSWLLGFCACTTLLILPIAFYVLYRGIDFLLGT